MIMVINTQMPPTVHLIGSVFAPVSQQVFVCIDYKI